MVVFHSLYKQYFFLEEIIEQTGEWIVLNLVQSKSSCDIYRFGLFSIVTIVKEYFRCDVLFLMPIQKLLTQLL
ncbi:unnamed protein product [Rhizophagus irregularis]|nr:unnamed protein product [Rhizophagus irregularis]